MAHADWIIDLGPGAGHDGGRIVFEGTPSDLIAGRSTLTGQHLADYVVVTRPLVVAVVRAEVAFAAAEVVFPFVEVAFAVVVGAAPSGSRGGPRGQWPGGEEGGAGGWCRRAASRRRAGGRAPPIPPQGVPTRRPSPAPGTLVAMVQPEFGPGLPARRTLLGVAVVALAGMVLLAADPGGRFGRIDGASAGGSWPGVPGDGPALPGGTDLGEGGTSCRRRGPRPVPGLAPAAGPGWACGFVERT